MKRKLTALLSVFAITSMLCGCSEAKDLCRDMLEDIKDFILEQDDKINETCEEYESIYEIIDTETALPDDSEYIPFPETDNPLKYDGEYFAVSPSNEWECYEYSENDCMYIIKEPETSEEAGIVVSFQVSENCGSNYIPLEKIAGGMDKIYDDMGYKVLEHGKTQFREIEAYCYTLATPYDNYFLMTSFQSEEHYYTITVTYTTNPMTDKTEKLFDEILSTFVTK